MTWRKVANKSFLMKTEKSSADQRSCGGPSCHYSRETSKALLSKLKNLIHELSCSDRKGFLCLRLCCCSFFIVYIGKSNPKVTRPKFCCKSCNKTMSNSESNYEEHESTIEVMWEAIFPSHHEYSRVIKICGSSEIIVDTVRVWKINSQSQSRSRPYVWTTFCLFVNVESNQVLICCKI